ncbi:MULTISPECIES: hypothetical protein [Flavobacterium]|uniref:Type II toxin-antitoxin system RelE/ParE family toxin n=1 Tax=Flavobacterium pectinovorum TaxID=29533 RepID=A0A502F687_9FLAO|nr:hypothetical protein [Flavobacterium pectinovorum]TPG44689.1 hypothetical protein EAH81_04250 [Flavobacterium pectinovorum]
MYEIIILVRADLEADEIAEYYESLSNGLGTKFFNEYQDYVETLKTFPFFEEKYNTVRILPLKKFPYSVHFTVNENEKSVSVYAVTSNHQDPNNTRIKL